MNFSRKSFHSILLSLLAFVSVSNAADSWFRPANGGTPQGDGSYDWDLISTNWYSNQTGGTGQAWSNNSTAVFYGAANGYTVNLIDNVTVGGISLGKGQNAGSGKGITFLAESSKVITLNSGAIIDSSLGDTGRWVEFGSNITLAGDFTIAGNSMVRLSGGGYSDRITIAAGTGGLSIGVGTSIRPDAKIQLNSGSLKVDINKSDGGATIGELSGAGGLLTRGGVIGAKLTVKQDSVTAWGGRLGAYQDTENTGANQIWFEKAGTGTLSLTGNGTHLIGYGIAVSEGALYVHGAITDKGLNGHEISVGENGLFGGNTTSAKQVIMEAATSQLSPGMLNEVGTLTLQNGLKAQNGLTVNFDMNGLDTLHDKIVVTGGVFDLQKTLTVNIFDLGLGGIEAGIAYTLMEGEGLSLAGWTIGELPTGWAVDAGGGFTLDDNRLQITFSSIPEPSTMAFVAVIALFGLGCHYRQSRLNAAQRESCGTCKAA